MWKRLRRSKITLRYIYSSTDLISCSCEVWIKTSHISKVFCHISSEKFLFFHLIQFKHNSLSVEIDIYLWFITSSSHLSNIAPLIAKFIYIYFPANKILETFTCSKEEYQGGN